MTKRQLERWRRAGNLARIAMGKKKQWGDPPLCAATEDPLAWWCLTEAIYNCNNPQPERNE